MSIGAGVSFSSQEQVAVSYDGNARPVKTELKSGGTTYAVTQTSYDALGRVDCSVQRMNSATFGSLPSSACTLGTAGSHGPDRIVKSIYDAAGRVTKVQTAHGTAQQSDEVTAAYTNNGRVAHVIDAENNRTGYTYDGHDRLVKTEYPSATKGANAVNPSDYEQLTYDANGNVTSRRLRDGQTISFTYDNLDRLTYYDQPEVGAHWDVAYEYDLQGRLTKATGNGWAVNTFVYDALGRMTSEQNYNVTTYHSYDAAGRQSRLWWHDGFYVDYDYDTTGAVTAIRENGATSGAGVLATYGYDNLGRRTSVTRGNGTVTSYGYDGVSRLASLTHNLAGSTHDLTLGFGYNPAGQLATSTRSNDVYAWGGHYNVDRSYTANGLNRLTAAGSVSLGYDGRGNLTTSGSRTYSYSVENRLKGEASAAITLLYEPAGGQLLQSYNSGTGTDTRFAWSGVQMITEISAPSWTVARRYVHGPGMDEPIVWYEGAGTSDRRWLHADERGSVIAVSDAAGAAIGVNAYDDYGIPASTNAGRFGYTGQAWLPELGLWYYKARMYSPTLGRFMQTDPIGYGDGMNWYNYVGSDPVNGSDPMGLCDPKRDCPRPAGYDLDYGAKEAFQWDRTIDVWGTKPEPPDPTQVYAAVGPNANGTFGTLGGLYDELPILVEGRRAVKLKGAASSTGNRHAVGWPNPPKWTPEEIEEMRQHSCKRSAALVQTGNDLMAGGAAVGSYGLIVKGASRIPGVGIGVAGFGGLLYISGRLGQIGQGCKISG